MKAQITIFILILGSAFLSCRETYNPKLEDTPFALVVDGLITNEVRAHSIRIFKAVRFDSVGSVPERGANVFLTDENGTLFQFTEERPGVYVSDPSKFIPRTGGAYFLTIRTKNDKVYKSATQVLYPAGNTPSITNITKEGKFSYVEEGKLQYFTVRGTQFLTELDFSNDNLPYYRYSNTFMAEFYAYTDSPKISYCWQKYNPNDYFNLTESKIKNSGVFTHDLGFCPVDSVFYGIFTREKRLISGTIIIRNELHKFFVSFKQYRLNKETYEYYKSLNKQLEARQQIFDPIPFQSVGNIKCINDDESIALGIFEVSAVNNVTFQVNPVPQKTSFTLIPVTAIDMDTIPNSGNIPTKIPKTWIY